MELTWNLFGTKESLPVKRQTNYSQTQEKRVWFQVAGLPKSFQSCSSGLNYEPTFKQINQKLLRVHEAPINACFFLKYYILLHVDFKHS